MPCKGHACEEEGQRGSGSVSGSGPQILHLQDPEPVRRRLLGLDSSMGDDDVSQAADSACDGDVNGTPLVMAMLRG